jgi:CBS domain-containing protein
MHLDEKSARAFRLDLQTAREGAVKDAEAFEGIIHAIERMGSFLLGNIEGLSAYQPPLKDLAELSALASDITLEWREFHTPFDLLYEVVKNARNDALHVGAYARHLTTHAIELALILEDALRIKENNLRGLNKMEANVSDFMIRNPVFAQLWQPISIIRQTMLTNSFSYLPVSLGDGKWQLVSDLAVASYLQRCSNTQRKKRLATSLEEAIGHADLFPALEEAQSIHSSASIDEALKRSGGKPLLVTRDKAKKEVVGFLTPFDLL